MKTKWVEQFDGFAASAILATAGLFLSPATSVASTESAFSQACGAGPEEVAEYRVPIQWNNGILQFACARLEDVVTEYNRHSAKKMVVRDSALGDVLVGGAFRTEDAEAFANGLEKVFGLGTHRHGNTFRISRGEEPISLTSRTVSTYLPDRARTKIGVGEAVVVTASTEVDWTLAGDGSLSATRGKRTTFTASDHASTSTLIAGTQGRSTSITFTVVAPESETVIHKEELNYRGRCLGAGMLLIVRVNPPDVSFENVEIRELEVAAANVKGYFTTYPADGLIHHPNSEWTALMEGNTTRDVALLIGPAPPWTDGSFTWPIPGRWRVKGSRNEGELPVVAQTFLLEAATHTATITKFGETVTRSAPQAVATPERQGECRSEENNRHPAPRADRGLIR